MKKNKKVVSYQTNAIKIARRDKYYKVLALMVFFLLWEVLCRINVEQQWLEPKFIPMPSGILEALYTYYENGTIFTHVGVSLNRVVSGYVCE